MSEAPLEKAQFQQFTSITLLNFRGNLLTFGQKDLPLSPLLGSSFWNPKKFPHRDSAETRDFDLTIQAIRGLSVLRIIEPGMLILFRDPQARESLYDQDNDHRCPCWPKRSDPHRFQLHQKLRHGGEDLAGCRVRLQTKPPKDSLRPQKGHQQGPHDPTHAVDREDIQGIINFQHTSNKTTHEVAHHSGEKADQDRSHRPYISRSRGDRRQARYQAGHTTH